MADFGRDFGEPNPVYVPKTYTEADLREAKAQALEDAAAAILTNDPLDFWSQHLPEGLGFQSAMSHWLKAHASAVRGEG
jgi:hypothetical protein